MKLISYCRWLAGFLLTLCLVYIPVSAVILSSTQPSNYELRLSEIAQDNNNDLLIRADALLALGQYDGRNALIAIARANAN